MTPFGFDFTPSGELIVSEASGGVAGAAAVSSYGISHEVQLTIDSASVPDGQTAACWLVVDAKGRYAFTANAGSGTISSYAIDEHGQVTLVQGVAGSTGAGSHTVDMAFAGHGRFLYALANGAGTLAGFAVDRGALSPISSVGGLPTTASGLVAR